MRTFFLIFFPILSLLTLCGIYLMFKPRRKAASIKRSLPGKPVVKNRALPGKPAGNRPPAPPFDAARARQNNLREIARKHPELVGHVIRQWLKEDEKAGS